MDKLSAVFATSLEIEPSRVSEDLAYNSIPQWDSVAHMALVAAIEKEFSVMLDTDEILAMNNVAKAREILATHKVLV